VRGPRAIPPHRRLLLAAGAGFCLLAFTGCDTGDGTTLRTPTAPTTQPPVESAPLPSEQIDDPGLDGAPAIDTIPIETLAGDDGATDDLAGGAGVGLRVFAPWADGGTIDLRYTCDGNDAAPSISWTGLPDGTAEIAISMVDESDVSSGRPFIHWVMAGIDPGVDRLGENEVPAGAVQGLNFFGDVGYTGPCPDPGTTGTYVLTVFALGQQLELAEGTPAAELLDVIGTVALDASISRGTATR
jgi:Raf kinase inhibitor-like YbhB/YbcL family protein